MGSEEHHHRGGGEYQVFKRSHNVTSPGTKVRRRSLFKGKGTGMWDEKAELHEKYRAADSRQQTGPIAASEVSWRDKNSLLSSFGQGLFMTIQNMDYTYERRL